MNCMKCGREIALGQVFCKECQADMANYPVNPGTPVVLPTIPEVTAPRRVSRKPRKPEEQLSRLRRLMILMTVFFTIVVIAGTMLIYSLSQKIDTLEQINASISQNHE